MPYDFPNVIQFPSDGGKDGGKSHRAAEAEQAKESETQAIASCLDYLHGEARKLGKTMTAHLIGAAAESLRQETLGKEESGNRNAP